MSSAKDVAEQTDVIVTGKTMNMYCSRSDQLLFIFVCIKRKKNEVAFFKHNFVSRASETYPRETSI